VGTTPLIGVTLARSRSSTAIKVTLPGRKRGSTEPTRP
jgi:hypothetical protein